MLDHSASLLTDLHHNELNSNVSQLDERVSLDGTQLQAISAVNEFVTLQVPGSRQFTCIDVSSSFGSVNFGHNNRECVPQHYAVDLVPYAYTPSAEHFSTWLLSQLQLAEHTVLFQVGGAHAVSAAFSLCQMVRPGKVLYVKGSFHGLSIDTLSASDIHQHFSLQRSLLSGEGQYRFIPVDPHVSLSSQEIPWDEIS